MAVPSEVLGLSVQGPGEAGFEGQRLAEAGSGGLGPDKVGFGGKRLNEAGFGMQGPDRAWFGGLRHPARQIWGQTPREAEGELLIPSEGQRLGSLGWFCPSPGDSRLSTGAELKGIHLHPPQKTLQRGCV